jgi:hypothetical protein
MTKNLAERRPLVSVDPVKGLSAIQEYLQLD